MSNTAIGKAKLKLTQEGKLTKEEEDNYFTSLNHAYLNLKMFEIELWRYLDYFHKDQVIRNKKNRMLNDVQDLIKRLNVNTRGEGILEQNRVDALYNVMLLLSDRPTAELRKLTKEIEKIIIANG